MPIVKIENSTQLEFGTGDINVGAGLLDLEEVVGVVTFMECSESAIGTLVEYGENNKFEISQTPVRMVFSKVESIDVLIHELEIAKQMMLAKLGKSNV